MGGWVAESVGGWVGRYRYQQHDHDGRGIHCCGTALVLSYNW